MGILDNVKQAAQQAEAKRLQNATEAETARADEAIQAYVSQAQIALLRGQRFFQLTMPVEHVDRSPTAQMTHEMHASSVQVTALDDAVGRVLTAVEDVGWELISSGYTFRPHAAVSRDKLLASGQQIAVIGQTVGIYLFRLRN